MARKTSKIELGWSDVRNINGNKVELTVRGWNSAGTEVAVKISMDDWELPAIAAKFKNIADKRVSDAVLFKQSLINSFTENR